MEVAIVTGSAGGLGKEFATRLLESGKYKVCLSDINEQLGQKTWVELGEKFGHQNVHFVTCNVTSLESVTTLWNKAEEQFGANVGLLVNNAGVMGDKESWQLCLDVNLTGVLNGSTLALERSERSGQHATVVNVSSILGLFCAHQPKGWAYNTSKSAVVSATRAMSAASTRVRFLCLCPSVTATPILGGCSDAELADMRSAVGGIMPAGDVGSAFSSLLEIGRPGDVMAVWIGCAPYIIPDTDMAMFIGFTACSMAYRYVPACTRPAVLRPWPHMVGLIAAAAFSCLILFAILARCVVA